MKVALLRDFPNLIDLRAVLIKMQRALKVLEKINNY